MSPSPHYDLPQARPVKCSACGEKHSVRPRRPGWCLTCDIRDRATTMDAEAIAAHFQLPRFLVEEVIA